MGRKPEESGALLHGEGEEKVVFSRTHLRMPCSVRKCLVSQWRVLKPKSPVRGVLCLTETSLPKSPCHNSVIG